MTTTFDGHFKSINSADTAPRDVAILGRFSGFESMGRVLRTATLLPAIWDAHREQWAVVAPHATMNEKSEKAMRAFWHFYFDDKCLVGWLPLPVVDLAEDRP